MRLLALSLKELLSLFCVQLCALRSSWPKGKHSSRVLKAGEMESHCLLWQDETRIVISPLNCDQTGGELGKATQKTALRTPQLFILLPDSFFIHFIHQCL